MRGYSYQVLCSVLAWVDLSEGELLFLEGAEDFDHIAGDTATTTQVRDTQGSGNVRWKRCVGWPRRGESSS